MKNEKGFSLIESLVAIAILVLVITGVTRTIQSSLSLQIFSKDQIVASFLAQEGLEHIRNKRDENGLNGASWLSGIAGSSGDPCYFGKACIVDAVNNTISACPSGPGSCPVLRQDASTGFFGYTGSWSPTIFRREIVITSINSNEVSVLVTVNWSKGTVEKQTQVRENILNWH